MYVRPPVLPMTTDSTTIQEVIKIQCSVALWQRSMKHNMFCLHRFFSGITPK